MGAVCCDEFINASQRVIIRLDRRNLDKLPPETAAVFRPDVVSMAELPAIRYT